MGLSRKLKSSFVAGLILVTPLVVTVYILRTLVGWSLQVIDPVVQSTRLTEYTANNEIVAQGVAAILIVILLTGLGYAARKSIGRRVFGNLGRVVNIIPLVNTVYGSVRQVANSLVERNTEFESVVLVEYPRKNMYSIGLVTGMSPNSVEQFAGQRTFNVFLPNSPNPTGGRLILLPEDQVHEIDMSVRRGMRLLVTTGMAVDEEKAGLPPLHEG